MGLNPDPEGSGGCRMEAGSGGGGAGCWGGVGWHTLGVIGLFGVDSDGGPSSVVQPPLLKPDVGGGGIDVTWDGSGGGGGGGEGGFCGLETVAHPDFLNPPLEGRLLTVDQPPVRPDFFSDGAGVSSTPGAGVCVVLTKLTTGATVLIFTPAALAAFRSSFSSLFFSFSLRFWIASRELAFARSFNCISLNRILWWWAYELQCSSYWATFWNCFSHTMQ